MLSYSNFNPRRTFLSHTHSPGALWSNQGCNWIGRRMNPQKPPHLVLFISSADVMAPYLTLWLWHATRQQPCVKTHFLFVRKKMIKSWRLSTALKSVSRQTSSRRRYWSPKETFTCMKGRWRSWVADREGDIITPELNGCFMVNTNHPSCFFSVSGNAFFLNCRIRLSDRAFGIIGDGHSS